MNQFEANKIETLLLLLLLSLLNYPFICALPCSQNDLYLGRNVIIRKVENTQKAIKRVLIQTFIAAAMFGRTYLISDTVPH